MGSIVGKIFEKCSCSVIENYEDVNESKFFKIDNDMRTMRNTLHSIDNKISSKLTEMDMRINKLETIFENDIKLINHKLDTKIDILSNKIDILTLSVKK